MTEQPGVGRRALGRQSLPLAAARGVACPTYRRDGPTGVVHLGLGAFQRAHQALVFDRLLASGDARWGVLGVAMRNPALMEALALQDHLYSVQLASARGQQWQVGGALWRTCLATRQRQTVLNALASPTTRWVTLTVTEKAYGPALADLLLQGLAARRAARLGGLTVASCDNLSGNGRSLRALCLQHAEARDPGLTAWVQTHCTFPNSMVDRIVPAGSDTIRAQAREAMGLDDAAALRSEEFWEWVMERQFVDEGDALVLSSAGVQVVSDVGPFEQAKLRLLNGSHSVLACVGAVAGLPTVSDCIAQPTLRQFVHGLMTQEIGPLLQRQDWATYRDALLTRFANPHLQHSVHQISSDSSLKIALRWVPAAVDALRAGVPVTRLAFCAAAWMRYCQGMDEAGNAYAMRDPNANTLQSTARAHAASASATFDHLGTLPAVWGEVLPRHPQWRSQVIDHLQAIRSRGVLASAATAGAHPHQVPTY